MNPIIHQRENNSPEPLRFEFYFQEVDTAVLVQTKDDCVMIRATKDSFSDRQRERFVHELALEGFVDDRFCHFRAGDSGVMWMVDRSWRQANEGKSARTSQIAARVGVCCGLLLLFAFAMSGVYSAMIRPSAMAGHSTPSAVAHSNAWSKR